MTEQAITIRIATGADADRMIAFNRAMANETEGLQLDDAASAKGVREALKDPSRCTYYLAEIDGAVVGQTMVTVEWSDWRNGFYWWIQSVYVEPDSRHLGVFRSLYAHVRKLARARPDVCGLRLYVYRENGRALETYRQLGMTVTDYQVCEEVW